MPVQPSKESQPPRRSLTRRLLIGSGFAVAAVTGCSYVLERPAGTYRFRLTIGVDTPEGPRDASGVLEANYSLRNGFMSNYSARADALLRGEAIVIDMGRDRNLVLLLTHGTSGEDVNQMAWLPTSALLGLYGWEAVQALRAGRRLEGAADLAPPLIPTLVTFGDRSDPASARIVPPTDEGFAATFGSGHRLARVRIEIVSSGIWPLRLVGVTGTPLTRGIDEKLPALRANGRPTAIALRAAGLTSGSSIDAESVFRRN